MNELQSCGWYQLTGCKVFNTRHSAGQLDMVHGWSMDSVWIKLSKGMDKALNMVRILY